MGFMGIEKTVENPVSERVKQVSTIRGMARRPDRYSA